MEQPPNEQLNKIIGGLDAFDFSLCERNQAIIRQLDDGTGTPEFKHIMKMTSSGTTIVGSVFKGGVVMGGDSRSTQGNIVANKEAMKLHYLTDRIFACGAGTAADLTKVAEMVSGELKLFELNSGKKARVVMAVRRLRQYLFQYMGHVGCYYLVGGVDFTGSHIYSIHAHGSGIEKPFDAEGSGSLCALGELETRFKPNMTEAECIEAVTKGLEAGMHGDNMSGNSYNLVIVTAGGMRREGPHKPSFCIRPNDLEKEYTFDLGTTKVLRKKILLPKPMPALELEGQPEPKHEETDVIGQQEPRDEDTDVIERMVVE